MLTDAPDKFRDAIRAAGLSPPDTIEPGRFHRFPGDGKRNGNKAGWCKLFDDGRGGIYGDYSTGLSQTWQVEHAHSLTPAERETFRRKVAEAKAQAAAKRQAEHEQAACIASERWLAAAPARPDHPYLVAKGVKPHGIRQQGDVLLIPMRNASGELRSLQTIAPNGEKRFPHGGQVEGCYFSIGKPDRVLCIDEGFATAASTHEATGHAVAVAFTAANIEAVAVALRAKLPAVRIIVCADDDYRTAANPGIQKATNAARAVNGFLAVPEFGDERPDGATDFNDLARHRGADAVGRCIANARAPDVAESPANVQNTPAADPDSDAWPEPSPLEAKIPSEAYPLDALPTAIRAAVEEVRAFTKAPVVLVASSALAALSLVAQAHIDIARADKLTGPVGLFLLTIADSGERKSTCDSFFVRVIREYEAQQAEAAAPELQAHKANLDAWEAKRSAILENIRKEARQGKGTTVREDELRKLEGTKPKAPRVPRLVYGDATPEALTWNLAKSWPSAGVLSSEAGAIFGAHGMGRDSLMRYLATLNELWDGKPQHFDRRTSESYTVRGARLTVALQIQEATLRSFFDRSGGLARGSGFLARFLIAWPESTMGNRPFDDPPKSWPALAAFHRRIAEILAIA
ncbi:MAG: DUF3987 domain-containing protein, partial [Betaproteobacteria bacterium]|nr:DUF3987 domain-containing protein [Betaproteobacteria bacterium]